MIEIPRISVSLRSLLTKGNDKCSASLDFNESYQQRIMGLRKSIEQAQWSNQAIKDGLTWDVYLGNDKNKIASIDSNDISHIRKIYKKFLEKIKQLFPESEQPVSIYAQIIYEIGIDNSKLPKAKFAAIQSTIGYAIVKSDWQEMYPWIQELYHFRETQLLGHVESKMKKSKFGCSIEFNYPGERPEVPDFLKYEMKVPEYKNPFSRDQPEFLETKAKVSPAWLVQECNTHVLLTESPFSGNEIALRILEMSRSTSNLEELQTLFFELLGATSLDLIMKLLENCSSIKEFSVKDINLSSALANDGRGDSVVVQRSMGTSITIQTEMEKRMEKNRRKQVRKLRKENGNETFEKRDWLEEVGYDAEYLRQERELGLQGGQIGDSTSYIKQAFGEDIKLHASENRGLPAGTIREHYHGYEEVFIPAPIPKPSTEIPLVSIDELGPFAQKAFAGISRLNRLQSHLFRAAYQSRENLLVCAPTGAGKTNVAMLTIVHALEMRLQKNGVLDKADLKIVYIAPMKALAQEVVDKFSKRLASLSLRVAELTGDMQMTKKEIDSTHVIVTTPEKWDVITRKSSDASFLVQQVRLLIIDEVHLLADSRGAVIETLVARTLRLVETLQCMIRIVGLSATLPNYQDVALFLRVNPNRGLFHFDGTYRPVPLEQTFIGITEKSRARQVQVMNDVVYTKVIETIRKGHQIMVFVHSRKETAVTIRAIKEAAIRYDTLEEFSNHDHSEYSRYTSDVAKSRNQDLREFFPDGFGIHHAGMLRSDRSLAERMFECGLVKVLCCTATLAWGVNLPAHTVVIKGTQVYNAEKGGMTELSMLDVMQIFGRAGRPQYDNSGEAILITLHSELARYLGLLTHQMPIESNFIKALPDHLNAEIASGTVVNMEEASIWLSYTYLYVRMMRNPMAYGITMEAKENDPLLVNKRRELLKQAANELQDCRIARFHENSGNLGITDWGRVASHFYIDHNSVRTFTEMLDPHMSDAKIFHVICSSTEFEQLKVRDDEIVELEKLKRKSCPFLVQQKQNKDSAYANNIGTCADKANILLQAYISQATISGFTLISDTNYVAQNAGRVTRALFEICLKKNWSGMADKFLCIAKTIDKRFWWYQSPLRQMPHIPPDIIYKIEDQNATIEHLADMEPKEIGQLIRCMRMGPKIASAVQRFPWLNIKASVQPITRAILRMTVEIVGTFEWSDKLHGTVQPWWIWVEDSDAEHLYHAEYFLLHKKKAKEVQHFSFSIPIFEPIPSQYVVRATSDHWIGVQIVHTVSFQHLILPGHYTPQTDLLDLRPLPRGALRNPSYESLYSFSHFNPVQTQIFHVLYHSDTNVLLGAPTGSGKTIAAEIAVFRVWNTQPRSKVVYIAPLKALSRERVKDWSKKFGKLGKSVVELTGDSTPDYRALNSANVIVSTPEKWDSITRGWKRRQYVHNVKLMIIDEVHLLGEDRGPIIEVIVSRMRYIGLETGKPCRLVCLSTALANAQDLALWLHVEPQGMFNFRPSVRPIPMEVHLQGFPGKHYCPRMATMNKPAFASIQVYSPTKPVLIFVASRRQTRLTALDLISFCAADSEPKNFLHMDEEDLMVILTRIQDSALKHTLTFGIGVHHAGLSPQDRDTVEELFCNGKIQILICTSTLAWGVNFPAHLVIIKGTEYYDGKTNQYVDFPITDVLQMMGRAGRPQFDTKGVACIFVHDQKKSFYKSFLYQPFPVESSLATKLQNHINAEVVAGSIKNQNEAIQYLKTTFFYRRLLMNPSYYHLRDTHSETVEAFILSLVKDTMDDLYQAKCITKKDKCIAPTTLGKIASFYYLDYATVEMISSTVKKVKGDDGNFDKNSLVWLLANAHEYDELPVRHNEDLLNQKLAGYLPLQTTTDDLSWESPHTKAYLLLQAHMAHISLPISDYINDTKSMLDQAPRILSAMVDIAADEGKLYYCLGIMKLAQMIYQARVEEDSELMQLPYFTNQHVGALNTAGIHTLQEAIRNVSQVVETLNHGPSSLNQNCLKRVRKVLLEIPQIECTAAVQTNWNQKQNQDVVAEKNINDANDGDDSYQGLCQLKVTLNLSSKTLLNFQAYSRSSSKTREHGFWLVLGQDENLLALKKVNCRKSMEEILTFPSHPSGLVELFVVSDAVAGIDQQLTIRYSQEQENKDTKK